MRDTVKIFFLNATKVVKINKNLGGFRMRSRIAISTFYKLFKIRNHKNVKLIFLLYIYYDDFDIVKSNILWNSFPIKRLAHIMILIKLLCSIYVFSFWEKRLQNCVFVFTIVSRKNKIVLSKFLKSYGEHMNIYF